MIGERWVIALGPLAVLLAFLPEWFGLISPSIRFVGDHVELYPRAVHVPPRGTLLGLLYSMLAFPLYSSLILAGVLAKLEVSERKVAVQAWHLQRLAHDEGAGPAGG